MIRSIGENYSRMFDVRGKSTRAEYWWFVLYYFIAAMILMIGYVFLVGVRGHETVLRVVLTALIAVWGVPTLIALLAAAIRRLHDIGRSGWYLLVSLVPIIGPILLLIL